MIYTKKCRVWSIISIYPLAQDILHRLFCLFSPVAQWVNSLGELFPSPPFPFENRSWPTTETQKGIRKGNEEWQNKKGSSSLDNEDNFSMQWRRWGDTITEKRRRRRKKNKLSRENWGGGCSPLPPPVRHCHRPMCIPSIACHKHDKQMAFTPEYRYMYTQYLCMLLG